MEINTNDSYMLIYKQKILNNFHISIVLRMNELLWVAKNRFICVQIRLLCAFYDRFI